ncbi:helix-turn-helix domain-containing protein [bacterium]|nr:helix-turn-helix domain-containing protein [bacterium]
MHINFSYSPLKEYQGLIYNLYNAESGFYKNEGMFLCSQPNISSSSVVIPNINEISKKSFWAEYKKVKKDIPKKYPSFKGNEFSNLFEEVLKLKVLDTTPIKREWGSVEIEFINIINTLFENDLDEVNVYLTLFGTVASYYIKGSGLSIYLRKDADISQIAFCILSYYIHKYPGKLTWSEQQRAVDFLLSNTKLNGLFPKFYSVIESSKNPECDISLILSSEKLYKELGINLKSSIEYKNNKVYILGEHVTNLTKQEQLVLHEMFINKNQVTTFEQISNILWGDDFSAFSLQAIAKTVERVRSKILNAGLNRQVIFTRRKEGYLLYD